MTNLIVEISKYLMILLMAVYTYANFRVFSPKDEEKNRMGLPGAVRGHVCHSFPGLPGHVPEPGGSGGLGALWPHFTVPRPYFSCAISAFPG